MIFKIIVKCFTPNANGSFLGARLGLIVVFAKRILPTFSFFEYFGKHLLSFLVDTPRLLFLLVTYFFLLASTIVFLLDSSVPWWQKILTKIVSGWKVLMVMKTKKKNSSSVVGLVLVARV